MVKRRKIRKPNNQESPSEKKAKDKDGEVAIARGRLAGALKGILNRHTDDSDEQESSSSSNHITNSNSKKLSRESSPALWKKKPTKQTENEDHQSYFMKLFDRSVDLAQFDINTPLYPLCRAWIQNQLFSRQKNIDGLLEIKHENEDNDSQFLELRERPFFLTEDRDIHKLPSPKPLPEDVHTLRIPSPLPRQIQEINLNPVSSELPTKEELLQSHLENWSAVRKRWRVASQKNEARYTESKTVLTKMFEKFEEIRIVFLNQVFNQRISCSLTFISEKTPLCERCVRPTRFDFSCLNEDMIASLPSDQLKVMVNASLAKLAFQNM